ncbi:MAG: hypothetical protein HC869_22195 [Rhodospirillales bacterium]|nr:hypothetical protein [Rhodospirillales bacterium]
MDRSIFGYIWRHSKAQQLAILAMTLLSFPFLYASLDLPKTIINDAMSNSAGGSIFGIKLDQVSYLFALCGIFLVLVLINGGFKYVINVYKGIVGERMLRRLRYELYARIMRFPLPHFRRISTGEIVQMINAEVEPLGRHGAGDHVDQFGPLAVLRHRHSGESAGKGQTDRDPGAGGGASLLGNSQRPEAWPARSRLYKGGARSNRGQSCERRLHRAPGRMSKKAMRQGAAVLFVIGSVLARTARQVSQELPIVFITPGDPVAAGLVASLAHPGGNTTAMTFEFPELSAKRLELLKELAPHVQKVLAIHDPRDASSMQSLNVARVTAPKMGMALIEWATRSSADVWRGLEALDKADALLAIPGGAPTGHYSEMIRAANAKRLPTLFHTRTRGTVEALASYGASDVNIARQAARLVDKILKRREGRGPAG